MRWREPSRVLAAFAAVTVAGVGLPVAAQVAARPCTPQQLYVSPQGKSIERARDEIRARGLNKNMRCDVVVNVAAGDYPVKQTIGFTAADSGSNGHRVIYRSAGGPGTARFLGAEPVTGWQPYQDGIVKTTFDPARPFYTLFEDGVRATTARYPNRAAEDTWAPYLTSVLSEPEKEAVRQWLYSTPGDWDPGWDLSNAQVTIWSGGSWSWFTDTVPIRDVNFAKNQMTLKYWTRYALINSRGGSRYFLQNSLSFLDQPGEYYADFKKGELYYKPRGGTVDGVMRPTVKTVFQLDGAHDLTLDGLAVQYTDFVDWYRNGWISDGDAGLPHKYPEYDRQVEMPRNRFGAITVTNGADIDLTRLHLSDTGFTAVYLLFANQRVRVSGSLLENIGADGIKVEGGWPGEGDLSGHHTFTNNYIHHYGELVPGDAAGVELMDTGHNEVSHSVIAHSARYAVSLEARPEVTNADNYNRGNTFAYLDLQQAGLDSGDMGAFYTYGVSNFEPHQQDNSVSQVVIGDVLPDASMPDSGTRGVHMDAGGCGFTFRDIQVGRVTDDKYQAYQCNTVENANWQADFDASRMEYDKIGVTADFPYARPPATVPPAG